MNALNRQKMFLFVVRSQGTAAVKISADKTTLLASSINSQMWQNNPVYCHCNNIYNKMLLALKPESVSALVTLMLFHGAAADHTIGCHKG